MTLGLCSQFHFLFPVCVSLVSLYIFLLYIRPSCPPVFLYVMLILFPCSIWMVVAVLGQHVTQEVEWVIIGWMTLTVKLEVL